MIRAGYDYPVSLFHLPAKLFNMHLFDMFIKVNFVASFVPAPILPYNSLFSVIFMLMFSWIPWSKLAKY